MTTVQEFEQFSYLFGANSAFVEELYRQYIDNPASVDSQWKVLFDSLQDDPSSIVKLREGASWSPKQTRVIGTSAPAEDASGAAVQASRKGSGKGATAEEIRAAAEDSIRALLLVRAYRVRGHLHAKLDPLGMLAREPHSELDPASYGFTEADYDRPIFLGGVLGQETLNLREIVSTLEQTYCGTMGTEFMHIQYPEQKSWLQKQVENARGRAQLTKEEKCQILSDLIEVEAFEQFLHVKFPGTKRFSIQGGDAMVPGLESIIHTASREGVDEIVIGMPHRGRMNVLTSIMGKPYLELLSIFHGNLDYPEWVESSGDVKYHLGVSSDRLLDNGKSMHLSLTANPSHLEAVNPVVAGKVRAKQDKKYGRERGKVMGVLMHGDAAFAGQGIVPETLSLSELKGYRTGGTVHVIVNNQIGFTTAPKDSRSTPYPSDVAKGVQAPIFHVNGDDPESVVLACRLATEFRQQFHRDVVVDIVCYRKYGHNEGDEPMFTQPQMYTRIGDHRMPAQVYAERLVAEGVITEDEVKAEYQRFKDYFEEQFEAGKTFSPNTADWLEGSWSGFNRPEGEHPDGDTGVPLRKLKQVGEALSRVPEGLNVNRKVVRMLENRQKMIESGEKLDWATGELLAYGTLMTEGYPVRLSGQDCVRGTFSHRHSELVDQDNENRYMILNHMGGEHALYEVYNSNLSEFAVLGFEYGYSVADPSGLTIWEAQFGDFANGAQVIIDQFIASGEIKWLRMSGLVMLLPHGYEGQGPEHSSARLERYLQLCAEDNMQVLNCTTPANLFHALRRQLHRNFRKPMVVMTPKSLLRHRMAVSTLKEMGPKTHFQRVIPETGKLTKDASVRRVVVCSGKVYYDLLEERETKGLDDIAIIRMEQYYPFPARELKQEFSRYPNAEVIWCQEEPKNNGAWTFVGPRIEDVLLDLKHKCSRPQYVGRKEAASPATGYHSLHVAQQKALVEEAISPAKRLKSTA